MTELCPHYVMFSSFYSHTTLLFVQLPVFPGPEGKLHKVNVSSKELLHISLIAAQYCFAGRGTQG